MFPMRHQPEAPARNARMPHWRFGLVSHAARNIVSRPIKVLELRCADGPGGGPEKTILLGAARSDPARYPVTVCYVRGAGDDDPAIPARAEQLGVDYVEIRQRHA